MTVVAHGGTTGAIVEIAAVVGLAALFAVVWLRGRRLPDDASEDEPADEQA